MISVHLKITATLYSDINTVWTVTKLTLSTLPVDECVWASCHLVRW